MKIALTGASSTGKTTVAEHLFRETDFRKLVSQLIQVDARKLLRTMGFRSMDTMSRQELRRFQIEYFNLKHKTEKGQQDFLVERSFVDVAAYWLQRDTFDLSIDEQNRLLIPSKRESRKYDIHFYFPFGLIQFQADGYRSKQIEVHKKIDRQIEFFLDEWNIEHIILTSTDIEERVAIILNALRQL